MSNPSHGDPPQSNVADVAHALTRAGLASVPLVGNLAAEIFNMVVTPPLEKRRDQWRKSVGEKLQTLESAGKLSFDGLQDNESFISTVMQASQAAMRTHQQEKLDALRDAVINSALPHAPEDSIRQIFITFVDELTVWHLRFLKLFQDPEKWFRQNGKCPPDFAISASLARLLANAYPELAANRPLYELIAADLNSRKLFDGGGMHTMMSADGAWQKRTSDFGDQFLTFIMDSSTKPPA